MVKRGVCLAGIWVFLSVLSLTCSFANTLVLNSSFASGDDILLDGVVYSVLVSKGGSEFLLSDGDSAKVLDLNEEVIFNEYIFEIVELENVTSVYDPADWYFLFTMEIYSQESDINVTTIFPNIAYLGDEFVMIINISNFGNEDSDVFDFELTLPLDFFEASSPRKCELSGSKLTYQNTLAENSSIICEITLEPILTGSGNYSFGFFNKDNQWQSYFDTFFVGDFLIPELEYDDELYINELANTTYIFSNNYSDVVNISDFFVYFPETVDVISENFTDYSGTFSAADIDYTLSDDGILYAKYGLNVQLSIDETEEFLFTFVPESLGSYRYYATYDIETENKTLSVVFSNTTFEVVNRDSATELTVNFTLGSNSSASFFEPNYNTFALRNESFRVFIRNPCWCNMTNLTLRGFFNDTELFTHSLNFLDDKSAHRFTDVYKFFDYADTQRTFPFVINATYFVDGDSYNVSEEYTIVASGFSPIGLERTAASTMIAGNEYVVTVRSTGNEIGAAAQFSFEENVSSHFVYSGILNRTVTLRNDESTTVLNYTVTPLVAGTFTFATFITASGLLENLSLHLNTSVVVSSPVFLVVNWTVPDSYTLGSVANLNFSYWSEVPLTILAVDIISSSNGTYDLASHSGETGELRFDSVFTGNAVLRYLESSGVNESLLQITYLKDGNTFMQSFSPSLNLSTDSRVGPVLSSTVVLYSDERRFGVTLRNSGSENVTVFDTVVPTNGAVDLSMSNIDDLSYFYGGVKFPLQLAVSEVKVNAEASGQNDKLEDTDSIYSASEMEEQVAGVIDLIVEEKSTTVSLFVVWIFIAALILSTCIVSYTSRNKPGSIGYKLIAYRSRLKLKQNLSPAKQTKTNPDGSNPISASFIRAQSGPHKKISPVFLFSSQKKDKSHSKSESRSSSSAILSQSRTYSKAASIFGTRKLVAENLGDALKKSRDAISGLRENDQKLKK